MNMVYNSDVMHNNFTKGHLDADKHNIHSTITPKKHNSSSNDHHQKRIKELEEIVRYNR